MLTQKLMALFFRELKALEKFVIFKGSVALNLLLVGDVGEQNLRMTEDIDVYLDRNFMKFLEFELWINDLIESAGYSEKVIVKTKRHPKNGSSGRISFYDVEVYDEDSINTPTFMIDVDIDPCPLIVTSLKSYKCVGLEKICADKITALSKMKDARRVKDVYDLFLIATTYNLEYVKIKSYIRIDKQGDFLYFKNNYELLQNGYKDNITLLSDNSLPEFLDVYKVVCELVCMFTITKLKSKELNATWNPKTKEWFLSLKYLFGIE